MDGSPIDLADAGPTLDGNPRAVQTRIEVVTAAGAGGQRAHDLRIGPQPAYVDKDRTSLNRVLIQPQTGTELRCESARRRKQRPTKRAMKSNAGIGVRGVITFGHEAQALFRRLSPEEQDTAYREFAEAVARRLGTTLTGLVVHCDESAPHAHFQLVGYDQSGLPISTIAKRAALRELQDLAAEVMSRHCPGVERGHSKIDRLLGGAKPAEVVNWSVAELHDRLPTQIAELRARVAELEGALAAAEEKARKNEALAQKAIAKARATKTADDKRARKAQRNIEAYERRAAAAREEAQALRGEVETLEARVGKLNEKAEFHAHEETRLQEKREELDARAAEIDGAQETADAIRRVAEDDARTIRDKAADEVLARAAEIATHEQTSRDKIAQQERALAKRHAGEDECTTIDRERLTAREAEIAAAERESQQRARRIQQDAERDAAAIEQTRARTETAAANLEHAVAAAMNGTHDDEVTREHIPDPVKLDTLRAHAPEGRPTWGFWFRFWSLNDPHTGAPLSLPETVRATIERAFDGVARLARRMAALAGREAELGRERQAWDVGYEARERALAEARKAEDRLAEVHTRETALAEREAAQAAELAVQQAEKACLVDERRAWEAGQAARDQAIADARAAQAHTAEIEVREAHLTTREQVVDSVVDAVAGLTAGIAEMVQGTYDKRLTIEDVEGDSQQFELLQRSTTKGFPTRGFRYRFHSLNFPASGEPRPLPGEMRACIRQFFNKIEPFKWEFEHAAKIEAQRDAILQRARTEATEIVEDYQARRDAALATLGRDAEVRQTHVFLKLMKDTLHRMLSEDVFQRCADAVNATWAEHPDNLARRREIEPPTYEARLPRP